MVTDKFFLAT